MLGLHFKLARRNLLSQKLYTAINLISLTMGLSICTLIGLFIHHELSYDKHFRNYDQVYRIAGEYAQGGDALSRSALTPYLLMPLMANNFGEDVIYTRLDLMQLYIRLGDQIYWEDHSVAVDSTFFDVFQTNFLAGDPETALDHPSGVVLDEKTALKYFKEGDYLGKSVEINRRTYQITGVIADLPDHTHFQANVFLPMASIRDTYPYWMTNTFGGTSHRTYFRTPGKFDVSHLESSLNELVASYIERNPPNYFFQPLADIHLKSDLIAEIRTNGSYRTIYIFFVTAIVILLLACINFINLSIAGSLTRLKEVGVKKVMGANRKAQLWQFQMEALIIGVLSVLSAMLLVKFSLPTFIELSGKVLSVNTELHMVIMGLSLLLVILISVIAGSFPALYLLKIPTSDAVTGKHAYAGKRRFHPRNVLVGVQFFLSAILIASTLIILQQINFMQNKDLGIDTEQIIMASLQNQEGIASYPILKDRLLQESSVVEVSASNNPLSSRVGGWRQYRKPSSSENIQIPTVIVGHDFFSTIDATFLVGRPFDKAFVSDYREAYVLNEEAVRFLDLKEPVGTSLQGSAFTGQEWSRKNAKIIGVVKDFHYASLHDKIQPVVFSLSSEITMPMRWAFIKISPDHISETLSMVETLWEEINPNIPLRYQFLNERIAEHYQEEARFLRIFSVFAGLSIFIGCLGLFGLTAFIMRKRTKEIGIRKVLGASQTNMLRVLSADFIYLVLISGLLGIPITVQFMTQWLENFEYRIDISWWIFGLTLLGSFVAAGLSIFYHSNKVARTNPLKSIKYE